MKKNAKQWARSGRDTGVSWDVVDDELLDVATDEAIGRTIVLSMALARAHAFLVLVADELPPDAPSDPSSLRRWARGTR